MGRKTPQTTILLFQIAVLNVVFLQHKWWLCIFSDENFQLLLWIHAFKWWLVQCEQEWWWSTWFVQLSPRNLFEKDNFQQSEVCCKYYVKNRAMPFWCLTWHWVFFYHRWFIWWRKKIDNGHVFIFVIVAFVALILKKYDPTQKPALSWHAQRKCQNEVVFHGNKFFNWHCCPPV